MATVPGVSRILVVDDDPRIARVLSAALTNQEYQVRTAHDGASGLADFIEWRAALVITDLNMPQMDGFELCRRVRLVSRVPIIVVSGSHEEDLKVKAFDMGADDYITKPFGLSEVLARARAMLRRSGADRAVDASFEVGDVRVDFDARRVHVRGTAIRLTPKEFELFVYMARRPNRVLSHRTLLEAVWGAKALDQSEYLRVFVGQLRKKLERDPSHPRHLTTEPWVGYKFTPQESNGHAST